MPKFIAGGFTQVEFAEAGVRLAIDPTSPEAVTPEPKTRVRCWLEDRSALAQVADDLIAVNVIGDYPGWDRLVDLFGVVSKAAQEGIPSAQARSLNLATIDRFRVPLTADFRLGDWIQCGGRFIPAYYADAKANLDINLGIGLLPQDRFNRQVALSLRKDDGHAAVQMRASFHDMLDDRSMLEVLESLHDESNSAFEAIITDRVRSEVMGGLR